MTSQARILKEFEFSSYVTFFAFGVNTELLMSSVLELFLFLNLLFFQHFNICETGYLMLSGLCVIDGSICDANISRLDKFLMETTFR